MLMGGTQEGGVSSDLLAVEARGRQSYGSLAAAGGAGTSTNEGAIFTFHQALRGGA